jgi:hypothetical protein
MLGEVSCLEAIDNSAVKLLMSRPLCAIVSSTPSMIVDGTFPDCMLLEPVELSSCTTTQYRVFTPYREHNIDPVFEKN